MIDRNSEAVTYRCDNDGCDHEFARPADEGLMASWAAAETAGWRSLPHAEAGPRNPASGLRQGPLWHYVCPTCP